MGNCLVTKMKSLVNNPDLPVLETMQQFTLDAITASGNSSMTDAQKWALNHFFYEIGAIDGSGIYSKLNVLLLPFIAGNQNGALVDHSKNLAASSINKNVSFSNGGFTAPVDNTYVCLYNGIPNVSGNYFIFLAGSDPRLALTGTKNDTQVSYSVLFNYESTPKELIVSISPYTEFAMYIKERYTLESAKGGSINVGSNGVKCLIFNDTEIVKATTNTYNTSEAGVSVTTLTPRANIANNAPNAYCFGSNLTDEEQFKFTKAMQALIVTFS